MEEQAPAVAPGRRFPRLSIPGSLLLLVCLFLPSVHSCGETVYPIVFPPAYPPYLFGLFALILALLPAGHKAVRLCWITWTLSMIAAVSMLSLFYEMLRDPTHSARRTYGLTSYEWIWVELGFWLLMALAVLVSLRHRRDSERWRAHLLFGGGGLCLIFFAFCTSLGNAKIGLWLSLAATIPLIIEGAGALLMRRLQRR